MMMSIIKRLGAQILEHLIVGLARRIAQILLEWLDDRLVVVVTQ